MNPHSFLQSIARAFIQSPAKARLTPRMPHEAPCDPYAWALRCWSIVPGGGWCSRKTYDGYRYRKLRAKYGFVYRPSGSQVAGWIQYEWWVHPTMGDVYKFKSSDSVNGTVREIEINADGSTTDSDPSWTAFANVENPDAGWTMTTDTNTSIYYHSTTSTPTGYPEVDFNIENTYYELELSDPVAVVDLVADAESMCLAMPREGSVDLVTNWTTFATTSYSCDLGDAGFVPNGYYYGQNRRTPTGIRVVYGVETPSSQVVGAQVGLGSVIQAGSWLVGSLDEPGEPLKGGTSHPAGTPPMFGDAPTLLASASQFRLALTDQRCCQYQAKFYVSGTDPKQDYEPSSIDDFYLAGTLILPDPTVVELSLRVVSTKSIRTSVSYASLPPCRDGAHPTWPSETLADKDCITYVERGPSDVKTENRFGVIGIEWEECQDCGDVEGYP